MKSAVIYARYSSERQTEQSIEGQLRVCNEYAERNDIKIIETYIDRAMTGTNDNRKNFQKMLRDSNKRLWDIVLVYKLDRFSRNKYEMAMHRKTLRDNGVRLVSAMENIPDTPEGIILESLLEGMAEYYSAELAQKVRRGLNENVQKGKYLGGRILFGYRVENKHIFINEDEAEIVRYIFQQYINGAIIKDLQKQLTEQGIYHNGKPFGQNTIYNMLKNEKYAGIFHYNGNVYTNIYPRIVPAPIFDKTQELLQENLYGKRSLEVVYLLRAKLFCGYCGKPMGAETGTSKNGKINYYYKCAGRKKNSGCLKENIKKKDLEDIVIETTFQVIGSEENISVIADKIMAINEQRIQSQSLLNLLYAEKDETQRCIDNLIKAMEQGILTASTKERMEELEEKLQSLKTNIIIEENKTTKKLTKEDVVQFLKTSLKSEPSKMIKLLVNKVLLLDDKIEIHYNFTDKQTPDTNCREFIISADLIHNHYVSKYNKNELNIGVQLVSDWLGISDSNTRMTESESVALPLGESPIYQNFRSFYLRYFIKNFSFWQAFL